LPDTSLQIIPTLFISIVAIIFVLLERLFPYQKDQKVFREGFFNDFFWYTIFQNYILGLIIFNFLNFAYSNTHLNELRLLINIPVWFQLLFFVISHDFYIYWFHRWQHKNKYLWRLHEAHHTTNDVDWLSGSRSHSLEILINQTIEFAPIVLLGASPEVAIYKGMISAIWGMFIHSNINVRLGWLQYFINGPEMHRWHHSDENGREYDYNYSTKFAIWDWLFKTSFFPHPTKRKPAKYGLSDTPDFPHNYFKQNLFAFRKFTRHF
jgi:sterol desaturase/sphingolipid hydroxylase (fatty acid hydroxylase superfamily)